MAERVACGLVQYIALRGDLLRVEKWPIGAVVAQACHASAAVLHQFRDDPNTQLYFKNLDNMRKVVVEVSSQNTLIEQSGWIPCRFFGPRMLSNLTQWIINCGQNNQKIYQHAWQQSHMRSLTYKNTSRS